MILTGAGISKESGLDTFRDADGLWNRVRIEDVATPEAYARDPAKVLEFYNARRRNLRRAEVQPNAAHRALVDLERNWRGPFLLVTQNIDDLHDRAGSQNLIHMHGEMLKARCSFCDAVQLHPEDLSPASLCRSCRTAGGMRPHVVWFGEMPLTLETIYEALQSCRIFVSIGTSGVVYPAAGFAAEARRNPGARLVELNLEPSDGASLFSERHYGPATKVVPEFVARLLAEHAEEP